jgi:hypothetical protein
MRDKHNITPEQAEEALDDPYALEFSPDPKSKSGKSDRYLGMCAGVGVLVVIVVRQETARYGANAWRAKPKDVQTYWDARRESGDG